MKIAIIGTTAYQTKMAEYADSMIKLGHEVKVPAFDNHQGLNEWEVCDYNRSIIEWADEIHVIWDARSLGTIFDLGMSFALRKKIKIIYLNNKTFVGFINQYAEKGPN